MPSSHGVTNFSSRGPGAVMRRAVTHEASAARDAPTAGAPSARLLAIRAPAIFLLRSIPPSAQGTQTPSIVRSAREVGRDQFWATRAPEVKARRVKGIALGSGGIKATLKT